MKSKFICCLLQIPNEIYRSFDDAFDTHTSTEFSGGDVDSVFLESADKLKIDGVGSLKLCSVRKIQGSTFVIPAPKREVAYKQ